MHHNFFHFIQKSKKKLFSNDLESSVTCSIEIFMSLALQPVNRTTLNPIFEEGHSRYWRLSPMTVSLC